MRFVNFNLHFELIPMYTCHCLQHGLQAILVSCHLFMKSVITCSELLALPDAPS